MNIREELQKLTWQITAWDMDSPAISLKFSDGVEVSFEVKDYQIDLDALAEECSDDMESAGYVADEHTCLFPPIPEGAECPTRQRPFSELPTEFLAQYINSYKAI